MYQDEKTTLVGGIVLILFAACVIVFIAGRADFGSYDPFDKAEVADYLTEIQKNKVATRVAFGSAIVIDAFIVLVTAAVTQILFRDRSTLLTSITFAGLVANAAVSGVADVVGIVLTFVADDYVMGGPGNGGAGSAAVLQIGRVLGMTELMLTHLQVTAFGISQLSLGSLLTFAPAGAINPPTMFGWVSMFSGAAAIVTWGALASDAFLFFVVLNALGSLVFFVGLGGWLILNRRLVPAALRWPASAAL